jgi:hypothetical protein
MSEVSSSSSPELPATPPPAELFLDISRGFAISSRLFDRLLVQIDIVETVDFPCTGHGLTLLSLTSQKLAGLLYPVLRPRNLPQSA